MKTPSQAVGEEAKPLWLRKGLLWGCRSRGGRGQVWWWAARCLPQPQRQWAASDANKKSPSKLIRGDNPRATSSSLILARGPCGCLQWQHVAQLMPAVNQLVGGSLPCQMLSQFLSGMLFPPPGLESGGPAASRCLPESSIQMLGAWVGAHQVVLVTLKWRK